MKIRPSEDLGGGEKFLWSNFTTSHHIYAVAPHRQAGHAFIGRLDSDMVLTFTEVAQQLGKDGVCVCPDFLTAHELGSIRQDLRQVKAAGKFGPAGIGQGRAHQIETQIRRDEVYWFDRAQGTQAQRILWDRLDTLRTAFNRTLFLGLQNFDGHYADYPAGGFYKRHTDSLAKDNNRIVSVVIYLNQDWKESDGGRLRIYSKGSHKDIDPVGGTLVCFMSEESPHEVLPSANGRLSFTGWFTR